MKAYIKKFLFGEGRRPFRQRLGLFRGLTLSLDPSCETLFLLGLYESETFSFLRSAGARMKTMIDVGAGYGEMTAWALRQKNIERVLAYDPKPERWPVFRTNMELNNFTNDTRLSTHKEFFPGQEKDVEPLMSLPEPVLLKVDVDGGELEVLRSIQSFLENKKIGLLLETHSLELDVGCREFLEKRGYEVTSISKAWWRRIIPEQRPLEFNQWLWAER